MKQNCLTCGPMGSGENVSCRILNPGIWSPEYSSRNYANHTNNNIEIQNPSSTDKSITWNPDYKTVLDSFI